VPAQKNKRHFHGEKLVALAGCANRPQGLFPAPVKPHRQRRNGRLPARAAHTPVAFQIQAHFQAVRMKTSAPVKFPYHREIMPFKTDPVPAHAAVEVPPPVPHRPPDRSFGEHRRDGWFERSGRNVSCFVWFQHAPNVPPFGRRATLCGRLARERAQNASQRE